jgi:hypothetical protein
VSGFYCGAIPAHLRRDWGRRGSAPVRASADSRNGGKHEDDLAEHGSLFVSASAAY